MAIRRYRLIAASFVGGARQEAGSIVQIDEAAAGTNMVLVKDDPEPATLDDLIAAAVDAIEAAALKAHQQDLDVQDLLNDIAAATMTRLNIRGPDAPVLPPPTGFASFSPAASSALTTMQIAALSSAVQDGMVTSLLASISTLEIAGLSTQDIAALGTVDLSTLASEQVTTLVSIQIGDMSTTDLTALTKAAATK